MGRPVCSKLMCFTAASMSCRGPKATTSSSPDRNGDNSALGIAVQQLQKGSGRMVGRSRIVGVFRSEISNEPIPSRFQVRASRAIPREGWRASAIASGRRAIPIPRLTSSSNVSRSLTSKAICRLMPDPHLARLACGDGPGVSVRGSNPAKDLARSLVARGRGAQREASRVQRLKLIFNCLSSATR
jgi:hypothetical protein